MNELRHLMKRLGYFIARASEWGQPKDILNLSGDRDVEWAWIAAHIPEMPGRVLDLGPSTSFTPLISAFNATEVLALDLDPPAVPFSIPSLTYVKGDILHGGLPDGLFDTIVNCSTTEHIGLSGRYGSTEESDGDLRAMALLLERMAGLNARMVFTIPVGRDSVQKPFHRIYGPDRLPKILSGYEILKASYFAKPGRPNVWVPVERSVALQIAGSPSFYALGLFVLAKK